jgi:transcription-repair coupling factor (superfamily II helicase)
VHNRVETIEKAASRLRELVPEARIVTAHGQLAEHTLEQVIAGFWEREADVLVCTTIVETGLDISNANTLIVDRPDRLGLAQLHQLRGRVGRGAEQSYCLLVSRSREELSETASERLEAMVATNDGFELADRDLEIRGEGQLLGARQSGYSDLRFVRLRRDQDLLERARDAARSLPDEGMLADDVDRLLGEADHLGES